MKISSILGKEAVTLSFEVFPPKKADAYESVETATTEIAKLSPSFMSVTYGAGGGTSDYTVSIASNLQNNCKVTALAHLSCVSSTKERIQEQLKQLREKGIENILALRGDIPKEGLPKFEHYNYASELVSVIKEYGGFCIGGACYPEGHPEADSIEEDIINIKKKVDAGCEFLTTQMFFDNNVFYDYLEKIRKQDIQVPIVAGIMPVTRINQIDRVCNLSGCALPEKFKKMVERFGDNPEAMKQAGISYATDQIMDLIANGVNNIHLYTMNQPEVARRIQENLKGIV